MWGRQKTNRYCTDPHHVGGGKRKGLTRTPEEHRKAVAALKLDEEQKPDTANRLDKEGWWRVLREMGYSCYAEYLQSDRWMKIRKKVLKQAKNMCQDCHGRASQVHHQEYTVENLRGANLKFLVALCDGCHHRRHGLRAL